MLQTWRLVARTALVSALAVAGPLAAPAAAADPKADRPVELIPLIGVRSGIDLEAGPPGYAPAEAPASLAYGIEVDAYLRPDAWFEAFLERQTLSFSADPAVFGTDRFDMNVDYLQFGGGYEPSQGKVVRPFVSCALGLTHYAADTGTVDNTLGFSGSLGGGFKAKISDRLKFKFEALAYATINDAALSVSCGPGCFVQFSSGGWYQFEARVGLAIRL
jgi:hypothetical protein